MLDRMLGKPKPAPQATVPPGRHTPELVTSYSVDSDGDETYYVRSAEPGLMTPFVYMERAECERIIGELQAFMSEVDRMKAAR